MGAYLGGPINELLSLVLTPALQRRRDKWHRDLADVIEELDRRFSGFDPTSLGENEAFVSAMIQAIRIAASTHQQEKREMLRNALVNIAVGKGPKAELQQVFLTAVDVFTCSHINVLRFFWKQHGAISSHRSNYGQAITEKFPELTRENHLVEHIVNDLRLRGFSSVYGPDEAFPRNPAITNLGIEFLHFIEKPQS